MLLAMTSVLDDASNIINDIIAFPTFRQWVNEVQSDFFAMQCHWHHMMPLVVVLVSHDATALVSALCDVDSILNDNMTSLRTR